MFLATTINLQMIIFNVLTMSHLSIETVYDTISNTFSDVLIENPLINDGPLNEQIESRTEALLWLSINLSEYDQYFDRQWFNLMYDELSNAITEIANFISETEDNYRKLYTSMLPSYRDHLTVFDDDFGQYINDARVSLLERFNEYISRNDWIKIYSDNDAIDKPLPFLDKLIIRTRYDSAEK